MAPSVVYTRASCGLTSSSQPAVLRSLTINGIARSRVVPVRTLWWWSRHGTWSSSHDENLEERIQRHQKIMRHRYSRGLRRRAMWERDDGISSWLWYGPDRRVGRRWGTCRAISSTDPAKTRLEGKHDPMSGSDPFWAKTEKDLEKLDKNFETFKAAIDRAIEKDPYGALFGRRLQSPPTPNNSSWISWLFNTNELKAEPIPESQPISHKRAIKIEVLDKKSDPTTPQSSRPPAAKPIPSFQADSTSQVEYTYDPVSGRNVPKRRVETKECAERPKGFLETLFSEHGSPPDKPVKQHRVYGYGAEPAKTVREAESSGADSLQRSQKGFENSRHREYQQLRASTLGNSIDTTTQYGGKFDPEPQEAGETIPDRTRTLPEPEEGGPLFSGTAYESKAPEIMSSIDAERTSWLEKEGFRSQHNVSSQETGVGNKHEATKLQSQKLEPSFDRLQSVPEPERKQFTTRLQPAIDRVKLIKSKTITPAIPEPLNVKIEAQTVPKSTAVVANQHFENETDRREDLDLLRASDVRAATKVARTTKQEIAQAKVEARRQLEDAFDDMQKRQPDEVVPDLKQLRAESGKLSRSIADVRNHAAQYPEGLVAKTMKSMGVLMDKFKDYQSPYNPARTDLLKHLDFKDESPGELPSIFKQPNMKLEAETTQLPKEAQDEQRARADLTAALRSSTKTANEIKKRNDAQIQELARGIRQIYEAEHGPIDLSLAQSTSQAQASQSAISTKLHEPQSQKSNDFYDQQAEFLSEVDQVATSVGNIKVKTAQLETNMKNNTLSESEASSTFNNLFMRTAAEAKQLDLISERFAQQQSAQQKPHPLSTATVKPGVPRYPIIERHTKDFEPRYIQLLSDVKGVKMHLQEISTSLHDLKRSRMAANMQRKLNTPVKEVTSPELTTKAKGTPVPNHLSSPYLILIYNKTSGEVDQTAMDRLPWPTAEKAEKANPIRVMGNLNYPAAFVTHFVALEKAGYELSSGGGDMLIFQKKNTRNSIPSEAPVPKLTPASKTLHNAIAADEASAQPEITETIAQPKSRTQKEAATVLDDIPVEVPQPGPAAPTAPPTNPVKKVPKSGPKVRRQEHVFSGTIPLKTVLDTSSTTTTEKSKSENTSSEAKSSTGQNTEPQPTMSTSWYNMLKKGVVGVATVGVAAYTIGVVAEGIGAQAQIEDVAAIGPRRKVVMPTGQRPGIYSTESSRID